MKVFSLSWRMAMRRKATCLLVVLSTLVATVFMLFYPGLIENTRVRLAETYNGITVTGSIVETMLPLSPPIPNSLWKDMQESGYFSELYGISGFSIRTFQKDVLEMESGENAGDYEKLTAFQNLLTKTDVEDISGRMIAYSNFESSDELVRLRKEIRWLDGYDESCLQGEERICIVSEKWGYDLGDTVPFLATTTVGISEVEGIFHLKVVGTYPGKITALSAVMPLKTFEALTVAANTANKQAGVIYEWTANLEEVYFTVKDNQQLDEIKSMMIERGLTDSEMLRLRIDDRILKETVDPIESNLAMLEGSYLFFFVMIAAIGFFISFLLARSRKGEYAVMRMLGESRVKITQKALLEQFIFCIAGVILGAVAVRLLAENGFNFAICAVILLCYTVGAAAAVMLTVRVNVMDILRDKE